MKPFVGLPTVQQGGCAYSADLDSRPCGQAPTWHVRVRAAGWGDVSLVSCDQHVGIARATGVVAGEHPYRQSLCDARDDVEWCWF